MDKQVYEYISKQTNDPIVEWKKCAATGKEYAVFASERKFLDQISPVLGWKMYQLPFSQFCPEERQRRRIAFRNLMYLYKWQCDATGQSIITMYRKPYTTYNNNLWRSDGRDPLDYGKDFDFSKTFTEQFAQLLLNVPKYATHTLNSENSQYANMAANSKNCYLVFGCIENEDCAYGHILRYSQDCYDTAYTKYAQNSYACIDCYEVTNVLYAKDCQHCTNSAFIYDCANCQDCFWCVGLKGAQYHIFNKQYSKEEYAAIIKQYNLSDPAVVTKIQKSLIPLIQQTPKAASDIIDSEQSFGDYIIACKNVLWFDIVESENVKYGYTLGKYFDSQDVCYSWVGGEQCYQTVFAGWYKIVFGVNCQNNSRDLYYCDNCYGSQNCFGCVGLKDKQYCIFNKQYNKDEYEKIVAEIITHMQSTGERGEFFDPLLSPFGYNETMANHYYPLEKQNAQENGFKRSDYESPVPTSDKIYKSADLPNNINEVNDDILQAVIACDSSSKPFRIIKSELEFYRKHGLGIPRKHPELRNSERLNQRHQRDLYIRTCDKTGSEILSVYPQDVWYKVYSQVAYTQEFYG